MFSPGEPDWSSINNSRKKLVCNVSPCVIYRVYGFYNGLQGGTITYETGGAKNSFNGFKIDLTGMEENESYFVDDPFGIGFLNEGFNYYKDFIMYG